MPLSVTDDILRLQRAMDAGATSVLKQGANRGECARDVSTRNTLVMNIAIFADVHGRALLCFLLCARWQQDTGQRIDLILQTGDLGTFPDHTRLDRATRQWGERDPSEVAFRADFTERHASVAAVLAQTTCPLVYVRGNHEDHQSLDARERRSSPAEAPTFPVDIYERIWCLKTGHLYHHVEAGPGATSAVELRVLGIGRIGPRGRTEHPDLPNTRRPVYLQPEERTQLARWWQPHSYAAVDVLLTHDAPPGLLAPDPASTAATGRARRGDEGGLPEIGTTLTHVHPAYYFFGHYGGPAQHVSAPQFRQTEIHKLADLNWDFADPDRPLRAGCMGILRWDGRAQPHHFALVHAPWLRAYTATSWRHVLPDDTTPAPDESGTGRIG